MLSFRIANSKDINLYYTWLNDPLVRTQSFNSNIVEFDEHKKWFENKLIDKNCFMIIFYLENEENVGQVRIEKGNDRNAIIGISIGSQYRGKGFSTYMLKAASNYFFESNPNYFINAFIKKENHNSKYSFENAGFEFIGLEVQNNINCLHYLLKYENRKL